MILIETVLFLLALWQTRGSDHLGTYFRANLPTNQIQTRMLCEILPILSHNQMHIGCYHCQLGQGQASRRNVVRKEPSKVRQRHEKYRDRDGHGVFKVLLDNLDEKVTGPAEGGERRKRRSGIFLFSFPIVLC